MFNKNDIINLEITDITDEGNGVGKHDGIAVFVPFAAVGDKLSVKIVKTQKSFAYGIIDSVISPSETRIENDCPVFSKCGGCSLRHISYEAELAVKENIVRNAFNQAVTKYITIATRLSTPLQRPKTVQFLDFML